VVRSSRIEQFLQVLYPAALKAEGEKFAALKQFLLLTVTAKNRFKFFFECGEIEPYR